MFGELVGETQYGTNPANSHPPILHRGCLHRGVEAGLEEGEERGRETPQDTATALLVPRNLLNPESFLLNHL